MGIAEAACVDLDDELWLHALAFEEYSLERLLNIPILGEAEKCVLW